MNEFTAKPYVYGSTPLMCLMGGCNDDGCFNYCPTDYFQCYGNGTHTELNTTTSDLYTAEPLIDCGVGNYAPDPIECSSDIHPEHNHVRVRPGLSGQLDGAKLCGRAQVMCQGCFGTAFGVGGDTHRLIRYPNAFSMSHPPR